MIPPSEWDDALRALTGARAVALACHIGPDGDALGSMLALGMALRARGTPVVASWGSDPFAVPRTYTFLPGLDLLSPPSAVADAPEVMVTFDAGSFERLGSLEANARAAVTLIVVDHHASNDHFGSINLIDATAAASAVLVHELIKRLAVPLDGDMATCLYAGLVTDTGRFQYANTTPAIHELAAELLALGVRHTEVSREIYDTQPMGYLKVAAVALERVRTDGGIVWTWLTTEDFAKHSVEIEDMDALIDLVRTADSADVAAVLKQQADGRYRVSMRSKGASNVGAVCESFGGGGHAMAAGFTTAGSDPHATIAEVAAALNK